MDSRDHLHQTFKIIRRERVIKEKINWFKVWLIGFLTAVASGVFANFIYDWLISLLK